MKAVQEISRFHAAAIRRESMRLTAAGYGAKDSLLCRKTIDEWSVSRPRMVARLKGLGILGEFAHVVLERINEATMRYLQEGMPLGDARAQAQMDFPLMGPEEETFPPGAELPPSAWKRRMLEARAARTRIGPGPSED